MTHPIPLRPSENQIQQAPSPLSNIRTRATASSGAKSAFTSYAFGPASWTRCYEIAMDYASEYGAAALYNVGDDLNVVACFKSADEIERDHPDLFAVFASNWGESKVNAERLVVVPPEQHRDVMAKDWSHIMSLSLPSTQLPHAAEVLPAIYTFAAKRLRAIQRAEQDEPAVVDAGASRPRCPTIDLDEDVTTFNGHYRYTGPNSYDQLVPVSVTTVREMLHDCPDNLTALELFDLYEFREVRIGGGAAGAFTLVLGKHGIDMDAVWQQAILDNQEWDKAHPKHRLAHLDFPDALLDTLVIYASVDEGPSVVLLGTLFSNFNSSFKEGDGAWGDTTREQMVQTCRDIAHEMQDGILPVWRGLVGTHETVIMRADIAKEAFVNPID